MTELALAGADDAAGPQPRRGPRWLLILGLPLLLSGGGFASSKLEVPADQAKAIERLLPRVMDAFNTFVTGIAPEAFERRGILEIMREELKTRVQLALKTDAPVDVLIMEFALK